MQGFRKELVSGDILLVSGGGKKRKLETVSALGMLASNVHKPATPISVAFNPYLPDPAQMEQERHRLRQKLLSGLVSSVYLQIGSDTDRLQQGLQYIQELVEDVCKDNRAKPGVLGSVLLPSRRLLAQMKFRPWNGVFLSDEYLSSVEAADKLTRQLLSLYAAHNVVPLIESAVKSEQDIAYIQDLLSIETSVAVCR